VTQINQSLSAVLRRRAEVLNSIMVDDEDDERLAKLRVAIARVADELEVRQKCCTPEDAETVAARAIAETRILRRTLVEVHNQLKREMPNLCKDLVEQIEVTVRSVPESDKQRRILAITVGDDATREFVLEELTAQVDDYFRALAVNDMVRDAEADEA
jgi:hypothetical protein